MPAARIPAPQAQPLQGIRVVEVGLYHAGPIATGMMAALGAEVVKVEDPQSPDPSRTVRRLYGQDNQLEGGRTVTFETYNAGKQGVTLNLKHAEGLRMLQALVARSDVFLHNLRAESAARLRIDCESLLPHNPRLVYAAVSGFGPQGPDAARPGLDPAGLARSGVMAALSGGSHREPMLPPVSVSDRVTRPIATWAASPPAARTKPGCAGSARVMRLPAQKSGMTPCASSGRRGSPPRTMSGLPRMTGSQLSRGSPSSVRAPP